MRIRWLGWAGVEIEARDQRVVVDPLQDAAAVFGWLAERGRTIALPEVVPVRPGAVAGLTAAELARQPAAAWASITAGAFTLTALPAVDGTGDPQVSWLIEADGKRVLHLGDTIWHGWWWRIAERYGPPDVVLAPINGARLTFPHRQPASPLPGAMEPEQAALAAELLQADRLVPIHYGGYDLPGVYEPIDDPLERLAAATDRATRMTCGETIEI